MKTVIQLLVAALVLHAAARVGIAFWRYYDFKDAVEQEARFYPKADAATLHQRVMKIAEERGIAIYPADIEIRKDTNVITVSALYGEEIELVPRLYTREHLFEFAVSVHPRALTPDALR